MRLQKVGWSVLGLVIMSTGLAAQPRLQVRTSNPVVQPGDTVLLEVQATGWRPKFSTLHVVVEEVNHGRVWRLRYPLLEGGTTAALVMPDSLPPATYALNFLLQPPGLHIMGQVLNEKPPKAINVMAKASNAEVIAKTIPVEETGHFQIPGLLFEDKATFVFSPAQEVKRNFLEIDISTPVDSAFVPVADTLLFVRVGQGGDTTAVANYSYSASELAGGTLQQVVVVGKKKTPADEYQDKYVRGFFSSDGMVFDGLGDLDFSSYGSVAEILNGRAPGLSVNMDRVNFESAITVRGFEPAYFLDEMQTDYEGILAVPTGEIALIKYFRPPFMGVSMGSAGGAIAVYTKRGADGRRQGQRNRFVIHGYTPQVWKLE